jgi:hypothetical protein
MNTLCRENNLIKVIVDTIKYLIVPIDTLWIMKKEIVITARVDSDIDKIIRELAKKDDRTIAWITRKLISEALESRGLLKNKD